MSKLTLNTKKIELKIFCTRKKVKELKTDKILPNTNVTKLDNQTIAATSIAAKTDKNEKKTTYTICDENNKLNKTILPENVKMHQIKFNNCSKFLDQSLTTKSKTNNKSNVLSKNLNYNLKKKTPLGLTAVISCTSNSLSNFFSENFKEKTHVSNTVFFVNSNKKLNSGLNFKTIPIFNLSLPKNKKTQESFGILSDQQITQTIHMCRKTLNFKTSIYIKQNTKKQQKNKLLFTSLNNISSKASTNNFEQDVCNKFIYFNPQKLAVNATLTFDRSAKTNTKKFFCSISYLCKDQMFSYNDFNNNGDKLPENNKTLCLKKNASFTNLPKNNVIEFAPFICNLLPTTTKNLNQGSHDRLIQWKTKLHKQYNSNFQQLEKKKFINKMQTNKWVSLELPIVNAQNKSNSSTFWKKIADSSTIEKVKDNTSALSDDECYYKNQIYLSNYFYKEKEDNLREKKNNNLKIKPLRYTQSASNALSYPINVKDFKNCLPKCKRNSFAEFDTNYIVLNKQNVNENKMEHCTLKQNSCLKTLNNNKCTFVIKKNNEDSKFKTKDVHTTLQQISNSYEKNVIKTLHCNHFDKTNKTLLPPPVKIMPYSGIKPQNNAIIKPIAFRPVLNKLNSNTKVIHRQSVGIDLTTSNKNLETQLSNENFCKSYKNIDNFENILHIDSKNKFKDQSQSISNLLTISSNSTQSVTSLTQASTSKYSNSSSYLQNVDFVFNKNIKSHFLQHKNSRLSLLNQKNNKNYNTISDYFDNVKEKKNNDKEIHNSNNCSSIYQFPPEIETTTLKKNKNYNILSSSMSTASLNSKFLNTNLKNQNFQNTLMYNSQNFVTDFNNQNKNNLTNSFSQNTSSSGASSAASTTLNNYSPSNNTKEKLFNVLNIDRCFTSLHITPSPSDSGIVDYETLIRDKEQELNSVRHAMEQNEEVLIRVYQEKEQQFKKEIFELKQKLKKNEKIDQELRKKLQECREVCQQLQNSVKLLTDDQNAQKKKDLFCCSNINNDRVLQSEIKNLREEVLQLREQLNQQNCAKTLNAFSKHETNTLFNKNLTNNLEIESNKLNFYTLQQTLPQSNTFEKKLGNVILTTDRLI